MKVYQLIEALKLVEQDLDVFGYCDHGQTPEMVLIPSVAYAQDEGSAQDSWCGNPDDAAEEGYTYKFIIL